MADLTLTYFDFHGGRGEDCRLALHIAGAAFVDERVAGPDWPARKAATPWRGLPTLRVEDGRLLSQSNAVLTYLGRRFDLHPTEPVEAARHEAVMAAVESLRHTIAATGHDDDAVKRAQREAFGTSALPSWMRSLEAEIRGPQLGGDTVQVADLKVHVLLTFLAGGGLDHVALDLDAYPKAQGLVEGVRAHPRVVDWYERQA